METAAEDWGLSGAGLPSTAGRQDGGWDRTMSCRDLAERKARKKSAAGPCGSDPAG
jgi:hypothetical protein